MKRCIALALGVIAAIALAGDLQAQRRITPVNNAATRTQSRNDAEADSARALQRRRDRSTRFTDENGNVFMVDTLTGQQWTDSTLLPKAPPMKYPLLHRMQVGVNIFDPLMRVFGAHYGGADASLSLSLHNRYIPVVEFGMGTAKNTPANNNFTYRSGLAPYGRIGLDYNFLYNSNPDYVFYAGVRYGFSAFSFELTDITPAPGYWPDRPQFSIPKANVTAGWGEACIGLKIKIAGNLSAGWAVKYHQILHQTHPATGDAWYVPGYGTTTSNVSAAFSFYYTLPWPRNKTAPKDVVTEKQPSQ